MKTQKKPNTRSRFAKTLDFLSGVSQPVEIPDQGRIDDCLMERLNSIYRSALDNQEYEAAKDVCQLIYEELDTRAARETDQCKGKELYCIALNWKQRVAQLTGQLES